MGGVALHVEGLTKRYGDRPVLRDLDLAVAPGEFVAIVGRSGCGKSTLLRVISGLESIDGGKIAIDSAPPAVDSDATRMMFQDARLLPWKRVLDNVTLGLARASRPLALDLLGQVGLTDRADDWPAVLSGGQRQRVALARALIHQPRLLLLDEPLGALDALTRIEMQGLIDRLWRAHGFSALLVTHDVAEAIAMADRVILIERGRITLDVDVNLPHPRVRGDADFGCLERTILDRVLRRD
ncbi:MAG: ATP-binding cassette domain-containing protein [Burkholderiales bacterium]|nr:ATP-binding cassette domain-containing protein [Burkholderiales bacterium]